MSHITKNWPPPIDFQSPTVASKGKERISYFHTNPVGAFHYGDGHPMKPARLALTHNLVVGYGLHKYMKVYAPRPATEEELTEFHAQDYIEFIKSVTPQNFPSFAKFAPRFNIGVDDCPVFEGMFDFFTYSAGSSLAAARHINTGKADVAINWSGGLHHAKKSEASGFCYVNDIVLAALELLRVHPRVVYIDIDVHHGDGVQEAFYHSNRVMTVSFHRYDGLFFPATGSLDEVGNYDGKYFSINVPLHEEVDDDSYQKVFRNVMKDVMASFRPSAVILQCGADSLAGDRLGCFNLSFKGHGACVTYMQSFNLPLIVVGGGGYTIKNVSRCWTYETSLLCGVDLPNKLPFTEYSSHYPGNELHPELSNAGAAGGPVGGLNTRQYLEGIERRVREYLRFLDGAPSVMMEYIPPSFAMTQDEDDDVYQEEDESPDQQSTLKRSNLSSRVHEAEYYQDDMDHDHNSINPTAD